MEDMTPCSVENQEVFQRVWQRVMAGRSDAGCPVECIPANLQGDLSCECLEALARQGGEGMPQECRRQEEGTCGGTERAGMAPMEPTLQETPAEAPMEPVCEQPAQEEPVPEGMEGGWESAPGGSAQGLPPADGPSRGNDLPRLWEEPQETSDRTARLRSQVMEALEGWQFYRHLARKARGNDARTLNGMAGELHRNARKLSAAYFLLTGLRYWPSELLRAPAIPSYWGALRARHQAEQRQETAFRTAADDWDDPDLLALYQELTEGCQARSRQLRALLEQDIT